MQLALIAHRETETNLRLLEAVPAGIEARLLSPAETLGRLGDGDAALARLDVLPTVDGIEPGAWELARLEAEGIRMLNPLRTLSATHDKLMTARLLKDAGVPHPTTRHVTHPHTPPTLDPPFVVKPRFGSWGIDVHMCADRASARTCLEELSARRWFRRQGALIQELIPPLGRDLRIVVASGQVVGAVQRLAAPGEWRTNVALGARIVPAEPPPVAAQLALAASRVSGLDLVGVDLLPTGPGGFSVIELNGAVEFRPVYALREGDVFAHATAALAGGEDEPAAVVAQIS